MRKRAKKWALLWWICLFSSSKMIISIRINEMPLAPIN
jgi:hypothetical protein